MQGRSWSSDRDDLVAAGIACRNMRAGIFSLKWLLSLRCEQMRQQLGESRLRHMASVLNHHQ